MYTDDLTRRRRMHDFATSAMRFARDRNRADLDSDDTLAHALIRCIEVVGEAASQVTPRFRDEHPNIFWSAMIGMCHRLVHAYVNIDLDVLWSTVTEDLPPLAGQLAQILRRFPE